jgi:hypothetical protein
MWQFYSEREEPVAFPERSWIETLDRPGAFQVGYLKQLIESCSFHGIRIPDQSIIVEGQGEKNGYIAAFRDGGNNFCMIYLPIGRKISVDLSFLPSKEILVKWFDPRTGKEVNSKAYGKEKVMSFTSPTLGVENDWVLIIYGIVGEKK